jgi:hypothetical protein
LIVAELVGGRWVGIIAPEERASSFSVRRRARRINRRDTILRLADIAPLIVFDVRGDGDEEQQGRPPGEERLSLR